MSVDLKTLEAQALELTPEERVLLVDRLLTSLFEDHDIEAEWVAEVERRIEDIEQGRSRLVSLEESLKKARAAIK
jgi:putative addiction module component (TIGR02574 family)